MKANLRRRVRAGALLSLVDVLARVMESTVETVEDSSVGRRSSACCADDDGLPVGA